MYSTTFSDSNIGNDNGNFLNQGAVQKKVAGYESFRSRFRTKGTSSLVCVEQTFIANRQLQREQGNS
jgi:hypothetical protein